jgi:hypothetical protein
VSTLPIEDLSAMKKFLIPFLLGVVFLAVPSVVRAEVILVAYLDGAGEVPPTDSPGLGIAVLVLDDSMETITYYVAFENLVADAIASHIHFGQPGTTGPIIFPFQGVPSATEGMFSGTLTPADFAPGGGLQTYRDGVHALLTGGCYVNIHSTTFGGGEIRGQASVFSF